MAAAQTGGFVKFSGTNTYGGTTTIDNNGGTLVLNTVSSPTAHAIVGPIQLNGGIFKLSGSGGDQISDLSAVTMTDGVLDLNDRSESVASVAAAGYFSPSVILNNGSGLAILSMTNNGAGYWPFAGTIKDNDNGGTGKVGITVAFGNPASDNLYLFGPSTFSGPFTHLAGDIYVKGPCTPGVSGPLGKDAPVIIGPLAGTLDIGDDSGNAPDVGTYQEIGSLSGGGAADAGAVVLGARTLATTLNGANTTFTGIIRGGSGATFTQKGNSTFTIGENTLDNYNVKLNVEAGKMILSRTGSTYAAGGDSTVSSGATLEIGAGGGNQINDTAALTVDGTFDLKGYSETIAGLAGAVTGVITNGGATPSTLTAGAASDFTTFSGTIKDGVSTLALTKVGAGTLVLDGTIAYTGDTTVSGGTLVIAKPTLAATSTVTVTDGVLELAFAGSETNQVAALVIDGENQPGGVYSSSTPGGYLTGAGSLLVSSTATTPTNITFSASGGVLTMSWPGSYLGWYAQSNSVNLVNTNFWFDIAGSELATNLMITLDPARTNVFYRMRKP